MASNSTLLSILLFLCCIVLEQIQCKTASCDMRGVHPSDCARYKKTDKFFYCGGDKEKKIPMKYVNDDYCDCIGSNDDEPGTSACNHGRFWCSNIGYRPRYIYSSLVNDGICDCCDGSDEYNNKRIKCPNICNEKAKDELQEFIQQKKKYMEGIKVKNSLLAVAKSKLNEKLNKKQQIAKDLEIKKHELAKHEEIKKIAEDKERQYREEKTKKEEQEKAKKAEEERIKCEAEGGTNCDGSQQEQQQDDNQENIENKDEQETKTTDDTETDEIREQIQREETSRERRRRERRERHEQRLQRNKERRERRKAAREAAKKRADEGQQQQQQQQQEIQEQEEKDDKHHEHTPDEEFPYPEQYRPHDEEEGDNKPIQHTPDEEFPYPEEYRPHHDDDGEDEGMVTEEKDDGFDWSEFDDEEDEEDMYIPPPDENEQEEEQEVVEKDPIMDELSDKARDARSDYNNIDREVRDLENDVKDINKMLEMDFGEKNIYASLFDECYTKRIDKYDYEFCPFKDAKQKEGSRATDLGSFKSFRYNDKKELVMIFDEGQKCWNGPKRSAHILFECNTENEIIHVTEPSTCQYHIKFATPLACNQQELDRFNDLIQNQFKTEL